MREYDNIKDFRIESYKDFYDKRWSLSDLPLNFLVIETINRTRSFLGFSRTIKEERVVTGSDSFEGAVLLLEETRKEYNSYWGYKNEQK